VDQQAESGTVSVQWVTWSVSLSTNYTTQQVGDSVELTATANNSVGGSPWVNEIYNSTAGTFVGGCNTGSVCNVSVSESSAASDTFVAYVADYGAYNPPPTIQATSSNIAVQWVSYSISLSVSSSSAVLNEPLFLSAVASPSVSGSPYYVTVYNTTTGALVTSCANVTTCPTQVAESSAGTNSFVAYVSDVSTTAPPPNVVATSSSVAATWSPDETPENGTNSIVVGIWSTSGNCVSSTQTVSLNDYIANTLPNEWYPSWNGASLDSGAVLIRTNGYYTLQQPDGNVNSCAGGTVFINIDTAQQDYEPGTSGKLSSLSPIDPITDATIALGGGALSWFAFNSCVQDETQTLAQSGYTWPTILTAIYVGGDGGCGNTTWSSVTFPINDALYS
jgi:hypothetical protein